MLNFNVIVAQTRTMYGTIAISADTSERAVKKVRDNLMSEDHNLQFNTEDSVVWDTEWVDAEELRVVDAEVVE